MVNCMEWVMMATHTSPLEPVMVRESICKASLAVSKKNVTIVKSFTNTIRFCVQHAID